MGIYVVTGGATGIGAAIVNQLRAQLHTVIIVDIRNADVVADLSTAAGQSQAVAGVLAKAPDGLDGLVACAGVGPAVKPFSLIAKANYFGAIGQPDQIASGVCFLLSDKASFICGSVLFVDGGHDAVLRPDRF